VAQAVANGKTNGHLHPIGHRATPQPKLAIARKKIASEIAPTGVGKDTPANVDTIAPLIEQGFR
jgi:hypothetical protein